MKKSHSRRLGGIVVLAALFSVLAYGMLAKRGEVPSQAARPTNTSTFNADRAFADLSTIVAFGPRPAASEALAKTRAYIVAELQKAGLKAELDEFEAVTPRGRKKMTNIRASRPGTRMGTIALVGHTGSGKSSIGKLIARFYEFQEGRILIDGHDIRALDLAGYRARLGIVTQSPFLFDGSVLLLCLFFTRRVVDSWRWG